MLAFRDRVASGQLHVLEVPPGDSLDRRVKPERLSDAHGGEGKAGQILPDHQSAHKSNEPPLAATRGSLGLPYHLISVTSRPSIRSITSFLHCSW